MGRGGGGGEEGKAHLQLANFSLGLAATLNIEIHKNSVRIKAPNSVNASKRKQRTQYCSTPNTSSFRCLFVSFTHANKHVCAYTHALA